MIARRLEQWAQAESLRDDWLRHCQSTQPADRPTAEHAIAGLYGLLGKPPPRFLWVSSPSAARSALVAHGARAAPADLRCMNQPRDPAAWPLPQRLATLALRLREAFAHAVAPPREPWNPVPHAHLQQLDELGPGEAIRHGVPLGLVLELEVESRLRATVGDAIRMPIRDALADNDPGPAHLAWYGQHEVWVAHLDILRRTGVIRPTPPQAAQLDLWTALGHSCGWWWPQEKLCVVAERPVTVHMERRPGPDRAGLRLHHDNGPAVAYPDGWAVHSWHGTRVPSWAVSGTRVDLIVGERNAEVRRCAIERIGWARFIEGAGLDLLGATPDPGNPGCELRLYAGPPTIWGASARILVAVNGSIERDGTRRTYGLTVPPHLEHPLSAAAWTYGLPTYLYARLARRT